MTITTVEAAGTARLLPRLPSSAWWVLAADALSAVGTGMALPFLMVYLHSVHGFGLGLAGAVVAAVGLACVVGNPLGGWLADRIGPRRALLAALPLAAIGTAGWIVVDGPATAFAAAAVSGLGLSMGLPAQSALLAALVEPAQRSAVFAVGNGTLNVGLALGGLLAAVVVDSGRPETFMMVYALDATTFALAATMIAVLRTAVRARPDRREARPRRGYRAVAQDRVLAAVWLLTAFLATVGFGQFNSVMPVLATGHSGLAVSDLGLVLAANTAAVVAAQLVVLRVLAGRSRVRAAAHIGPLWAVSWCLMLAAGAFDAHGALVMFLLAAAVFGLGETLLWPTLPAIVNDIAPDDLRGRYNGAFVLALTTGTVVGPVLGAAALANDRAAELLVALAVACAASGVAARKLRRLVPADVDKVV
jgi:MFS family permease